MQQRSCPAGDRRHGILALGLVALLCSQVGCYHWVPSTPDQIELAKSPATVRVSVRPSIRPRPLGERPSIWNELSPTENETGTLVIKDASVRGGSLIGAGGYTLDVGRIERLEVRKLDVGATVGVTVASVVGVVATPFLILLAVLSRVRY
jgi:hypothetical protein